MQNRFIVPQFIDAEDKIWGPLTVRQFVIMILGGLFIFLSYKLSDFTLFLFQTVVIILLVVVLAFLKINGAPFHMFLLNVIQTIKRPWVRIWHKEYIKVEDFRDKGELIKEEPIPQKTFLPNKKLSELSLIIDTGGVYKGESEANIINSTTAIKK
ncbi:MAG: PrgI family protein [Patescibacteria group bacterium]